MAISIPISLQSIGGNITAIMTQRRIDMAAFGYSPPGTFSNGPDLVWMGGIVPVTAQFQEQYRYEAEVTRYAIETGSNYTDHVILQPIQIDFEGETSNLFAGQAKYSLTFLEWLWMNRAPLILYTKHKQITNMIMRRFEALNEAPLWGRLKFTASFQQVMEATIQTQNAQNSPASLAPGSQTSTPDVSKSAENPTNNGQQTPQSMNYYNIYNVGNNTALGSALTP